MKHVARYSVIMSSCPKRLYTEEQAGIYMGYPAVFERCLKAGWIARADKAGIFKMPVYDSEDMDACIERLKAGEIPEEELTLFSPAFLSRLGQTLPAPLSLG